MLQLVGKWEGGKVGWLVGWLGMLVGWLVGWECWLVGWEVGMLVGWEVGMLVGLGRSVGNGSEGWVGRGKSEGWLI